jgi:hypothetical protein
MHDDDPGTDSVQNRTGEHRFPSQRCSKEKAPPKRGEFLIRELPMAAVTTTIPNTAITFWRVPPST